MAACPPAAARREVEQLGDPRGRYSPGKAEVGQMLPVPFAGQAKVQVDQKQGLRPTADVGVGVEDQLFTVAAANPAG